MSISAPPRPHPYFSLPYNEVRSRRQPISRNHEAGGHTPGKVLESRKSSPTFRFMSPRNEILIIAHTAELRQQTLNSEIQKSIRNIKATLARTETHLNNIQTATDLMEQDRREQGSYPEEQLDIRVFIDQNSYMDFETQPVGDYEDFLVHGLSRVVVDSGESDR